MKNNTDNKKGLGKFFVLILCAAIIGGIVGGLSNMISAESMMDAARQSLILVKDALPAVMIIVLAVIWIIFAILYRDSKIRYAKWDGENENEVESIELKLSYLLLVLNIAMILIFFIYAMFVTGNADAEKGLLWPSLICLGGFIMGMATIIWQQYKIVAMVKEINPEKKGSIFETKFHKQWEASCDEAERLTMYKAGYRAFKITTTSCIGMWLVCALLGMQGVIGVFPVILVSIIWLILTVSYHVVAIQLEKQHINM